MSRNLLHFFVISLLLFIVIPLFSVQQARVKGILDTGILINIGSKSGVNTGLTGKIYYEITVSGEKKPIYIAKFTITRVNENTSEAVITEKEENVKIGNLIKFDQKLIPPVHKGKLNIDSNPSIAEVYINRIKRGKTPLELSLEPKTYDLRVSKEGYERISTQITIKSNQTIKKSFKLTSKIPSFIKPIQKKAKRIYKNKQGYWEAEFEFGIFMVYIPEGEFYMGSNESEKGRYNDEGPVHRVYLDGYWIGKYEVTFDQYDFFCDDTSRSKPSNEGWGRGNRPVINVTWDDAVAFCQWLSRKTGLNFHLPTEAQWEKACRAGTQTPFYFGSSLSSHQANFDGNYPYGGASKGPYLGKTAPVGNYSPNGCGIYDMHGNVWEWCSDWYDQDYYNNSPYKNPDGPSSGSYHVYRGGGWSGDANYLRCADRDEFKSDSRGAFLGFRLCQGQ